MKSIKFRALIVLIPFFVLIAGLVIFQEYSDLSAQSRQDAQVVHTNDYIVNLDIAPQTPLNEISQSLEKPVSIVKSNRYDLIKFNSKRLNNNLWGAPLEETLTSVIYLNENKTFGWYWNRPNPLSKPGVNGYQPIYPNIKIGGNPWETSMTSSFPVKVSEIKTLTVDAEYSYPVSPTGTYNLAYDLFLSDTNQACSDPKPKSEIMVWLHHTLQQPPDAYRGDCSDGINTFEMYSFTMPNNRLYYAFVMKEQPKLQAQYTINIGKLLENLKLDSNWFLHGVELGNEVVNGNGCIEIKKINVNLNGVDL
jgi:hypothetical protein